MGPSKKTNCSGLPTFNPLLPLTYCMSYVSRVDGDYSYLQLWLGIKFHKTTVSLQYQQLYSHHITSMDSRTRYPIMLLWLRYPIYRQGGPHCRCCWVEGRQTIGLCFISFSGDIGGIIDPWSLHKESQSIYYHMGAIGPLCKTFLKYIQPLKASLENVDCLHMLHISMHARVRAIILGPLFAVNSKLLKCLNHCPLTILGTEVCCHVHGHL